MGPLRETDRARERQRVSETEIKQLSPPRLSAPVPEGGGGFQTRGKLGCGPPIYPEALGKKEDAGSVGNAVDRNWSKLLRGRQEAGSRQDLRCGRALGGELLGGGASRERDVAVSMKSTLPLQAGPRV